MDGYKATLKIKHQVKGQATAIIALERAVILSAGCNDFMRNPFKDNAILAQLPTTWVTDFQQATIDLDIDTMLNLAEQMRDINQPLATYLNDLIQNFKYDELTTLLNDG